MRGRGDNLLDDLAAASVLRLNNLRRPSVPFSVTATCDRSVLEEGLSINLLDEQGDKFINRVLALVDEDVDDGSDTLLECLHIVRLERRLHVLFDLRLEELLLFVELFLELDTEALVFGGDITEGLTLQLSHLIVDLLYLTEVLTSGRLKRLLQRHLDIEQVTLQLDDQLGQPRLHNRIVFVMLAFATLVIIAFDIDFEVDVLLFLLVLLDLSN